MSRALALAVLFASGCRAILGLDEGALAADAAPDVSEPTPDATPPWTIELVDGIADDQDPTLPADMLELYFAGAGDIHFMTRTSTTAAWSLPSVSPISSASTDSGPELTADGLGIVFSTNRGGAGFDIYFATRTSRTSAWGAAAAVPNINSTASDTAGSLTQDDLRMVFSSNRAGDQDLYEATRVDMAANFDAPVSLSLNISTSDDDAPHLTLDGLTVYYSAGVAGARDLVVATRPTLTDPWISPLVLTELSSSANDSDPWVSPDGNDIYFSSNRDGTTRVYHASR